MDKWINLFQVLVIIGLDLLPLIQQLELRDAKKAFPSFITIFLMPLLYSIDKAIFAGLAAHIIMHLLEALHFSILHPRIAARNVSLWCRRRCQRRHCCPCCGQARGMRGGAGGKKNDGGYCCDGDEPGEGGGGGGGGDDEEEGTTVRASVHSSRSRPRTSSAVHRAGATVGSALIKTVRARHESLSSG